MMREGISWMHLLLVGCCLIGALGGQGRSSCNTIACPKTRNYICGSDGKTYRNECQLQKRACKGPHIDIAYNGRCGSASKRKRELVIGGYEWDLAAKVVPRGSPNSVIVNVSVTLNDNGGNVNGVNLWRIGIFGSQWNDGWGERKNEMVQILNTAQQNQPARGGTPLEFLNVEGDFDYTELGCNDEFGYICLEVSKGSQAQPDFQLQVFTFQDSLIICDRVTCQEPVTPPCVHACPDDSTPVCGSDGRTYPNNCEIENEIRCHPNASLEVVFEDRCDAGVTVNSIFWSVEATSYVLRGPSLLLLDAIVLTNGTLDVSGTGLWRLGIFGSQNLDGSGPRLDYQHQLLNSTQAAMPLVAALPINLHFEVPVEFNVAKLGCTAYKALCLEFAKGDNAAPDFSFRASSGKAMFIGCRTTPCNGPEDDGTGRLRASIYTFNWGLRAAGSAIRGEPVDVQLSVSVPTSPDSNDITGSNLWRIGLYGSNRANGMGDERFGYIRQTITDDQVSSPLIYPTNMEFLINTQFIITGVGCGDYPYLCVELAKADDPQPNFILNDGGDPTAICQRVACNDAAANNDNTKSPSVARLSNLNWNLEIEHLVYGSPSNITLQVTVLPVDSTDSIAGEGLWRLGIYFSTSSDGRGERYGYTNQILPTDYTALPLASRVPLVFLDVIALLDVTGLGCNNWRFVCIEFAKGEDPRPDFELPLPGGADFAVSCRSFPCTNGGGENAGDDGRVTEPEYVPGNSNPHVDPNTQGDGTGQDIPSVSVSSIRISNFRSIINRVQFLLAVTPGRLSQFIEGEGLWRIGLYASSDRNGQDIGTPHTRQVLNSRSHSKSLRPPSQLVFDIDADFQMQQIGCGNMRFLCIEFGKGDNPVPDFNLILPGSDTVVTCQLMPCDDPNIAQQATAAPHQQQKTAHLARFSWEMNPLLKNPDGPSDVSFSLTLTPQPNTDIITGTGLWRVGIFGSKTEGGSEPRTSYKRQVLNQLHTSQPLQGPTTFDIQTTLDMTEMGCGPYKFFCVEFAKGDNPQPEFNMPLNGGDALVNCQHVPCRTSSAFLTTSGPPTTTRPQVLIRNIFPEEVSITEGAQNQLDVDVEVIYDQLSDDVTGNNMWRLELWTSAKSDGSGTRVVSLDQSLTDEQSSKDLVKPYPLTFTNIRMDLDMRANRCSYVRYICARLSNSRPALHGSTFDLSAEAGDMALTGCSRTQCLRAQGSVSHPSTRPLVKFSGITVGIPTIEENVLNKLALRVNLHVPMDSDAVSGSQLWRLAVWGSKKANGGGQRYSSNNQALIPQQADMSVIPPSDLVFEYVRFNLDMTRVRCKDISYVCVAISTESTTFDLQGVPNDLSMTGCTTITCETASVPELVVNSVALILPPTPIVAGQSNPMTMDFEIVYDVGNSVAVNGNNNWRVKIWGSDRANGGGPRLSQSTQALTRQQASQPLMIGRPFTIRGIEYVMNLRDVYCRDVGFVCAQLVAGNNSFRLRPIPNKKSLTTCQRLHCING